MKRPYKVYRALGQGPYQYVAAYATEAKAEAVCAVIRTQHGAEHGEPFYAYWDWHGRRQRTLP